MEEPKKILKFCKFHETGGRFMESPDCFVFFFVLFFIAITMNDAINALYKLLIKYKQL